VNGVITVNKAVDTAKVVKLHDALHSVHLHLDHVDDARMEAYLLNMYHTKHLQNQQLLTAEQIQTIVNATNASDAITFTGTSTGTLYCKVAFKSLG
jgi:hypothetical protein